MIDASHSLANVGNSRIQAMHQSLIKLTPGLTTVACKTPDLIIDVREALIAQALHGRSDTGLSFKQFSVRCFFPGDERQKRYEAVRRKLSATVPEGVEFEHIGVGTSSSFNFCSVEGRQIVLPYLETERTDQLPCYYVFAQEIANANSMLLAETLIQFRAAAKHSKANVIAILACESGFENSQIHELGDEHISINECEADDGYDRAFEIDVLGLRRLNRLGIGRTMCRIGCADSIITYEYEPFIAGDARGRAIWWLRATGRSYAQIGDIFDINKSTVMRQLNAMPRTTAVRKVDERWLNQLIEHGKGDSGRKAIVAESDLDLANGNHHYPDSDEGP